MTDKGLTALQSGCKDLAVVNLTGMCVATPNSSIYIARIRTTERAFDSPRTGCTGVTDEGVTKLMFCEDLQRVYLAGCTGVTKSGNDTTRRATFLPRTKPIDPCPHPAPPLLQASLHCPKPLAC